MGADMKINFRVICGECLGLSVNIDTVEIDCGMMDRKEAIVLEETLKEALDYVQWFIHKTEE